MGFRINAHPAHHGIVLILFQATACDVEYPRRLLRSAAVVGAGQCLYADFAFAHVGRLVYRR